MAGFIYLESGAASVHKWLEAGARALAPQGFEGQRGRWQSASSGFAWCHGAAPFSRHDGERGSAFLWGDAIPEDADAPATAETVYRTIAAHGPAEGGGARRLARYSGLFAWVFVASEGWVEAGCDPFGIFPVYFFQQGDAFGFASSLSALHAHPAYDASIDRVGMMRYLIENGCSGPRTMERSGRRLEPSCSLRFDRRGSELRLSQHPPPCPEVRLDISFDEAVERSVEVTRRAVHRHARANGDARACLLSGGLDSRQILGFATEIGLRPRCLTAGRPTDYDGRFACQVARSLDLKWDCADDDAETAGQDALDELRLQSLGGGFSCPSLNGGQRQLRAIGGRCLNGLILDGHHIPYYRDRSRFSKDAYDYCFEQWVNRFGVDPAELRNLCGGDREREADLDAALAEIRQSYDAIEAEGLVRLWRMFMRGRGRAHLGGGAWKGSFFAWPAMPSLDVGLAEAIRALPDTVFMGRALQRKTLECSHPKLARIPLVGMSHSPKPITPNVVAWLQRRHLSYRAKLMPKARRGQLHRFERAMHFDSPAWRRIRERAEPHRPLMESCFDAQALRRYLPPFGEDLVVSGSELRQHGGRRLMTGLMLWMGTRGKCDNR
jgi:hypothetical protein